MRITKLHVVIILVIVILGSVLGYIYFSGDEAVSLPSLVDKVKLKLAALNKTENINPQKSQPVPEAVNTQSAESEEEEDIESVKNDAVESITVAKEMLNKAYNEGRDIKLPMDTVSKAQNALDGGLYKQAWSLARQSIEEIRKAQFAESSEEQEAPDYEEQPEPAESGRKGGVYYTVKKGDTLWGISKMGQHYGLGSGWVKIWRTNEKKISDFDLIYPGQEISIPEE